MVTEKSCNLSEHWVDLTQEKGSGTGMASSEEHLIIKAPIFLEAVLAIEVCKSPSSN